MADAEGEEGGEEPADGVACEPDAGAGGDFVAGIPNERDVLVVGIEESEDRGECTMYW